MPEDRLVRQTVEGIAGDGPPYPPGSLLMDFTTIDFSDIKSMAEDRTVCFFVRAVEALSGDEFRILEVERRRTRLVKHSQGTPENRP